MRQLLVTCVHDVEVDGAGLSLRTGQGGHEPAYGTDAVAESLEHLQFTLGQGPSVDAVESGAPVLVPDLRELSQGLTDRWPVFVRESVTCDVRAVFAFPLRIGAIAVGCADLYRHAPGPLSQEHLARALTVMDSVTLALLDGVDGANAADGHTSAAPELLGMSVHRAAGMVMVQLGSSIDEALVRLRGVAFAEGVPIDELADEVVNGRRRFDKEQS